MAVFCQTMSGYYYADEIIRMTGATRFSAAHMWRRRRQGETSKAGFAIDDTRRFFFSTLSLNDSSIESFLLGAGFGDSHDESSFKAVERKTLQMPLNL